ncbi:MAG TPA: pirin family protein [Candidatus Limnocylindria bacterium]|nr:pirin family protein [Candidatus Limnocylindria bacterium]
MPAVEADTLALPRLDRPDLTAAVRPVVGVVDSVVTLEGEGFQVRRPFPGIDPSLTDPFLLLDHLGAVEYSPGEAKGAPDHPHRGFETVTYVMDGAIEHRDSTGGGGVITDGATQWMTAGAGIVHSEMPTHELLLKGGLFHGTQLWVNLPAEKKWSPPRYQDINARSVRLLASHDGASLVRLIAGDLGGHAGPGITHTPIVYAHASIAPDARLEVAWPREFNALAYVLSGHGTAGIARVRIREGQLAVFGAGDAVLIAAEADQTSRAPRLEVLLLGGRPIREAIAFHGPFVMNTREEIIQAIADYRAGRMGVIPPARHDVA